MLAFFSLMWLFSYTHYTAIGFDHDINTNGQIRDGFYRMHWPGDGSLWLGYGLIPRKNATNNMMESFDPAAVLFQTPRKIPEPLTFWNRLGFWHINATNGGRQSFWLGVPAWLPVLGFALLFIIRRKNSD